VEVGLHEVEAERRQDKDLKRCFGRPEKIIDCEWEFLSKLKTLKEPHESMPRLADLLEYLAQPGMEDIWAHRQQVNHRLVTII
jgi:hypothetical protein